MGEEVAGEEVAGKAEETNMVGGMVGGSGRREKDGREEGEGGRRTGRDEGEGGG